jgi:uncharacterized protein (DUF2147 family)
MTAAFVRRVEHVAIGVRSLARWRAGRVGALTVACWLAVQPDAAAAVSPVGLWWAEWGAAQVEIAPCGGALCGRVVWLRSPFGDDGCPLRDERNPDSTLRARAIIGIELLSGLRAAVNEPRTWTDGVIYDPTSGRTYDAMMTLTEPNRLNVRGYVGFRLLGRTVTWRRVGTLAPCGR